MRTRTPRSIKSVEEEEEEQDDDIDDVCNMKADLTVCSELCTLSRMEREILGLFHT